MFMNSEENVTAIKRHDKPHNLSIEKKVNILIFG